MDVVGDVAGAVVDFKTGNPSAPSHTRWRRSKDLPQAARDCRAAPRTAPARPAPAEQPECAVSRRRPVAGGQAVRHGRAAVGDRDADRGAHRRTRTAPGRGATATPSDDAATASASPHERGARDTAPLRRRPDELDRRVHRAASQPEPRGDTLPRRRQTSRRTGGTAGERLARPRWPSSTHDATNHSRDARGASRIEWQPIGRSPARAVSPWTAPAAAASASGRRRAERRVGRTGDAGHLRRSAAAAPATQPRPRRSARGQRVDQRPDDHVAFEQLQAMSDRRSATRSSTAGSRRRSPRIRRR